MRPVNDKVTIIGAGFVGATSAYALINAGVTSQIAMVDINEKKLDGEVMDLNHGISFVPPVRVYKGDYQTVRIPRSSFCLPESTRSLENPVLICSNGMWRFLRPLCPEP
jgi:hypothetical protein